jgi:hypothetical protein
MNFEITSKTISPETELPNDEYSVTISLFVKETSGKIPLFQENIVVISHNSKTGFEVDEQRETAISDYLQRLNG